MNSTGKNELFQKNKRRTKAVVEGRTFVCGCSRAYLSYAALYTHIKSKHGGVKPPGTSSPNEHQHRGRPKKQSPSQADKDQQSVEDLSENQSKSQEDGRPTINRALDMYLASLSGAIDLYAQRVMSLYIDHLRRFAKLSLEQIGKSEDFCQGDDFASFCQLYNDFINLYLPQHCPIIDGESAKLLTMHLDTWLKWKGFANYE